MPSPTNSPTITFTAVTDALDAAGFDRLTLGQVRSARAADDISVPGPVYWIEDDNSVTAHDANGDRHSLGDEGGRGWCADERQLEDLDQLEMVARDWTKRSAAPTLADVTATRGAGQ